MTPVYNGQDFIQRCYRNLLCQTHEEWQWVVVDDGSTDRTLSMVKEIAGRDPRVKIVSYQKNRGRGYARNIGIANAAADWVVIWDVDDLHFPERLAAVDEARRQGYDFFCSYAVVVDNSLTIKGTRGFGHPDELIGRGFVHPTLACRTEILAKIGYRETRGVGGIGEDIEVCWLLPLNYRGRYCENALSIYQEDREVTVRKARDSNIARAALLIEMGRRRSLRIGRAYWAMVIRCFAKVAVLWVLGAAPSIYRHTVRMRSYGAVLPGWRLSDRQMQFIEMCRQA